jgi:ABC-type sugar transport system permease subunit
MSLRAGSRAIGDNSRMQSRRFWKGRPFHARLRTAGFLFVLPALLFLLIFKFLPMLDALRLSFSSTTS